MAQYKYKAQTIDGKKMLGTMNAGNEAELQLRLHEQDAFLLSAKAVSYTHLTLPTNREV